MSRSRSDLLGFVCRVLVLSGLLASTSGLAQDRRHVSEPGLPVSVCATLTSSAQSKEDTQRLQDSINHCQPGSAVRLIAGAPGTRFVSGPLIMKSGVTLWLDRDAVLAATTDPRAYDNDGRCGTLDDKGNGCRPFILFKGTQGGGIVGEGVIDGQGGQAMFGHSETWWQLARRAQTESSKQNIPRLIQIDHAHDITFYKVTLHNSPNFHVAMNGVQGATFWDVRIDTPADARNTDGIDPGASQDVTIAHSFIRTGDDNVAIKAGSGGATRYISLIDNHFYWGHGLSIGSETVGGVSDVRVQGLTLDGTTSGLRIKSDASRGGVVSNVRYEHVCLRNNRRPIDFDTRYDAKAQGSEIPVFRDIVLRDVIGASGDLVLRGYDDTHQLGITLDGVRFAPDARWQIEFARIETGPGGVRPALPGKSQGSEEFAGCAGNWVSFPGR
ncbi:endo-polygalacturonase (plasmid) [Rahnella sikkimica]|uniref:Endo-polygalacturonase n=1 Tax=Rahnella sikkimica TaxID=1805933 RepID=A0A2L1UYB7_9GAMM|nr:glycosyl hydrolase family 28 protein [Rahnella sikkimica]AVF37838.1 endo-polygalacturonase [Rahnella sikkimica]